MRGGLFYIPTSGKIGEEVEIRGPERNHIVRVSRHRQGDTILAADGFGNRLSLHLTAMGSHSVTARILSREPDPNETRFHITLAQAVPKVRKMDLIISKCTELGVERFIPFLCQRAIPRVRADTGTHIGRWRRVAVSAMKQSLRTRLPEITEVVSFAEVVRLSCDYDRTLLAWEALANAPDGGVNARRVMDDWGESGEAPSVLLVVGPEGGFTQAEIAQAEEGGAQFAGLGPFRLRSDTAAIALVSLVMVGFAGQVFSGGGSGD